MLRLNCFYLKSIVLASSLLIAPLVAQTETPVAAPALNSFTVESIVPFDDIDTINTPNLTPDILSSIKGGAMEVRQQIRYDSASKTVKVTALLEAPGSPLPTPTDASGLTTLYSYTVNVSQIQVNNKRGNAVVVSGTANNDAVSTPFGDISGSSVTISAAYKTPVDPVPVAQTAFTGVSTNIAGIANLFSKAGMGTVSLASSSHGAPTAVAGPKNLSTGASQFQLDATGSSDTSGSLTYAWTFTGPATQGVTITGANTATPTVNLPGYQDAAGIYTFQLTVTNPSGLTSTDTVAVNYDPSLAPPPPPPSNQ